MFSSKYYDNPFADDDNDLCYGEILSDQGDTASHSADHSGVEWQEKRSAAFLAGSHASVLRRSNAEASSAEIAPSVARGGDVGTRDYEDYIAELRTELESANAENTRLSAAQTKAEARARSLLFDKENAEWQLQQEKERSRALTEKVAALEKELEQLASRTNEAVQHRIHVDPHTSSDLVTTPLPERARSMRARAQFEQRQAAYQESRGGSLERDNAGAAGSVATDQSVEPPGASPNFGLTRSLRGQRRAEAVQEKILEEQRQAHEQAAAVKALEELLQTHCQKRDELATQFQRLESMRLRTVAEKRKKAAVEASLEEEEKTIGHIRLELRSYSALLR